MDVLVERCAGYGRAPRHRGGDGAAVRRVRRPQAAPAGDSYLSGDNRWDHLTGRLAGRAPAVAGRHGVHRRALEAGVLPAGGRRRGVVAQRRASIQRAGRETDVADSVDRTADGTRTGPVSPAPLGASRLPQSTATSSSADLPTKSCRRPTNPGPDGVLGDSGDVLQSDTQALLQPPVGGHGPDEDLPAVRPVGGVLYPTDRTPAAGARDCSIGRRGLGWRAAAAAGVHGDAETRS